MRQSLVLHFFALFAECLFVLLCFNATLHFAAYPSDGWRQPFSANITERSLLLSCAFLAVWVFCFSDARLSGLTHSSKKGAFAELLKGGCVITCVLVVILMMAPTHAPLRMVLGFFWLWSIPLASLAATSPLVLAWFKPIRTQNIVILGTGPIARRAWKEVRTHHHQSFRVVGFVDTLCLATAPSDIRANYLGTVDDLSGIFLRNAIDLMIVAMPVKSCYETIQQAIHLAGNVGIELVSFDRVFQKRGAEDRAHDYPRLVFDVPQAIKADLARFGKRIIDVVLSAILLVVSAPLLLSLAFAIKLTSPGPVLFIQERYGYHRRKFRLLKFRTMVTNAEALLPQLEFRNEAVGPIFKIKQDPRVTPIGRFLRRTSLDELPQLWNVLIGSMSLVGPRPMSVRDVSLFSEAHLMRRFQVKPGITGLWQVSGRSNTTFEEWITMDFSYIDRWSLMLDFTILLRTIPAVLRGSGAM